MECWNCSPTSPKKLSGVGWSCQQINTKSIQEWRFVCPFKVETKTHFFCEKVFICTKMNTGKYGAWRLKPQHKAYAPRERQAWMAPWQKVPKHKPFIRCGAWSTMGGWPPCVTLRPLITVAHFIPTHDSAASKNTLLHPASLSAGNWHRHWWHLLRCDRISHLGSIMDYLARIKKKVYWYIEWFHHREVCHESHWHWGHGGILIIWYKLFTSQCKTNLVYYLLLLICYY